MPDRKAADLRREERIALYGARSQIGIPLEKRLKLQIPFEVYFQDPALGVKDPKRVFDTDFHVPWEPGISDGPTSARFAVVDYDGDTGTINPPAVWDRDKDAFVDPKGKKVDSRSPDSPQFHQVSVWAVVQNALEFFESGAGLGRRIPWAFEGNRLILVPHAGYAENAFYDRHSKSLQLYYFEQGGKRINTCLSSDIINHEFGHAALDGIRPYYLESVNPETAAFHEFVGDLTAILIALRNNAFRNRVSKETKGDLSVANAFSNIAEQFGEATEGKPYLRSAVNKLKMKSLEGDEEPHKMSEVLTGAMFDIVINLSKHYLRRRKTSPDAKRPTPTQAFWHIIQRMQHMAIQPLDLLPPVDVTFRDYALAVLRAEELANPTDPDGYRDMMLKVFLDRGLLDKVDATKLKAPHHVIDRLPLDVEPDIGALSGSRAEAYRLLDDNRRALSIPHNADLLVADLYTAHKLNRQNTSLPKQIVLTYVWREDVPLAGAEFGRFNGEVTNLLCGGTLVFDDGGRVLHWATKPGSKQEGDTARAKNLATHGAKRVASLRNNLKRQLKSGRIGDAVESDKGLISARIPPLTSRMVDGAVRFERSPHFSLDDHGDEGLGSRQWEISS